MANQPHPDKQAVTWRLPRDLVSRVRAAAAANGETVLALVTRALEREVDGDAFTAELQRLRAIAGGARCVECGQVEAITADGILAAHTDTATDELCIGSGESDHEPPNLVVRVLDSDDRKELEDLRRYKREHFGVTCPQGHHTRNADLVGDPNDEDWQCSHCVRHA